MVLTLTAFLHSLSNSKYAVSSLYLGLRGFWFVCFVIAALLSIYFFLVDVRASKVFKSEVPMVVPLRSVYQ